MQRAQNQRNYLKHKAKRLAAARLYRQQNREWLAAQKRVYREANKELIAAAKRTYKARKRDAVGTHNGDDVKEILKRQRGRCAYCRCKLKKYHVDHIHPLALGGTNWPNNLQILCAPCNLRKKDKDAADFARELGFLI